MLQSEFESRIGRNLNEKENFETIHKAYMALECDKDKFAELWNTVGRYDIIAGVAEKAHSLQIELQLKTKSNKQSAREEGELWDLSVLHERIIPALSDRQRSLSYVQRGAPLMA